MVFSDLHVGDKYKEKRGGLSDTDIKGALLHAMSRCNKLVLAGDIVELLYPKNPETAQIESLKFLKTLCGEAKKNHCSIEFLFGNHEYSINEDKSHTIPENFVRGLLELQEEYPKQFHLHPVAYRFGSEAESVLVWHGDLQAREHERAPLAKRCVNASEWWRAAGSYSDHERSNRLKSQLETILSAPDADAMLGFQPASESWPALGAVKRITFGHTHDPFVGASLDLLTFPRKPPPHITRRGFVERLGLVYDNPGTAKEEGLCFPVLYHVGEKGEIAAQQYKATVSGSKCTLDPVDPGRQKIGRWGVGV